MATRSVRFGLLRSDGVTYATGSIVATPTRRRGASTDVVLPTPLQISLPGAAVTRALEIPDGATWAWQFQEKVQGGATRYCTFGAGSTINYVDLTDIDPRTLTPTAESLAAWTAAVAATATSAATAAGAAVAAASSAATITTYAAPKTAKTYLTAGTGGDDSALIQAAIDSATGDELVRIVGNYSHASTIIMANKNVDCSGAVFTYTGSGLAIQIGSTSSTPTFRKNVSLPRVICGTKPGGGGWASGTIGVKITNAYSYTVVAPHIFGFEVGLLVYGENSNGTSYTTVYLGHLENNKVNQKLDAQSVSPYGWSNQNVFIGGRFSHPTNEGTVVSGTKHIYVVNITGNSDPNNNTWINPSLESANVVEWTIDAEGGSYNLWLNGRYEYMGGLGLSKVRWGSTASRNHILEGNMAEIIAETHVAGSTLNQITTSSRHRMYASAEPGIVMENNSSGTAPIVTFMNAGGTVAGDDPTTEYMGRLTARQWSGKRSTDTYDRFAIDVQNGRFYSGDATAAPVAYWGGSASTMFLGGGVPLCALTDNAQDIGLASSLRFRNLNLAGKVKLANGPEIVTGSVSPEAAVTAPVGSIYLRTGGGAGTTFYVKETGAGNTGWVAK